MNVEKLKANVVEAPTIFIGVGGTGCKIVKKVYNLCAPGEKDNVSFVCMDTNVNDLNEIRGDSKDIVCVQTSSTQTVGRYLDNDDEARKHWFPNNAVIYDKTVSEGAGQLRAISRLALNSTIKSGKAIQPLYDAIDTLFKKNGQAMKQALRICVVSTASGGTGSGMILPFCMFVRDYVNNKYPNASVILRSMILLPETLDKVITSNIEKDSQRRNAYATIKELNAFMMKGSGFCEIENSLKRYKDLHVNVTDPGRKELKSLAVLPCDFCFLLDGQDAEDAISNSFEQYKDQAALALYEQMIGPMQKHAFSVEDNIIKELSNPGNYGRNRFGGIGAGRIQYPFRDVIDYVAYDWAIDSIGGQGEAAKWLKYDNKVKQQKEEDEKAGKPEDECQKPGDVYCQALLSGEDKFSKDVINRYRLQDADEKLEHFLMEIERHVTEKVGANSKIKAALDNIQLFGEELYNDETRVSTPSKPADDFDHLCSYADAVIKYAERDSKSVSENLLWNETKTLISSGRPEYLESIMRIGENICHPNAARFMLYKLKNIVDERFSEYSDDCMKRSAQVNNLRAGGEGANYSLPSGKGNQIQSLQELCEKFSKTALTGRKGKKDCEAAYPQLNAGISAYKTEVDKFFKACIYKNLYQEMQEYVSALIKEYQKFYNRFAKNVKALDAKKQDLVDRLKYKKGDSIRYVCATKGMLEELSASTKGYMENGSLLDSELNAKIFDQIKNNVRLSKEYQSLDIVENDEREDIFETTMLDYFKESVYKNCKDLDMNIIEAIGREKRLQKSIELRSLPLDENGEKQALNVSDKECIAYVKSVIEEGSRIAAPGIQRIIGEEPREVNVCAYNAELKNMRGVYRVSDLLPNAVGVDTVSRYELHYFNALYNLTPDKLKKFAAPKKTETGAKPAGLYHNAYTTYTRDIGPDCLKSSKMTTHIDRRWDSIAAMPEMDLDYQHEQFMRTHMALIYGLVFRRITKIPYLEGNCKVDSPAYAYRYRNTSDSLEDMVVSNGTLCDEFYEILDSLYIDRRLVEDIYAYEKIETSKDVMRKVDFCDTSFYKNYLQNFAMPDQLAKEDKELAETIERQRDKNELAEDYRASIFQIPLAYYNSLPSRLRDESELTCLVDATIRVLESEINKYESAKNSRFILCDVLKKQFDKLTENYDKDPILNKGIKASDNKLLEIIDHRVRVVLETSPQPENYEEMIADMARRLTV